MRHPDEGEIHAWLDGALDADAAAEIEAHAAACAQCAAEVATARGLIAGASRILLALDAVPGGVIPAQRTGPADGAGLGQPGTGPRISEDARLRSTKTAQRRQLAWFSRPSVRIAAGLVLAVGIGAVATRESRNGPGDQVTIDFRTEPAPAVTTAASPTETAASPEPETAAVFRARTTATLGASVADAGAARAERVADRPPGITADEARANPAELRITAAPRVPAPSVASPAVAQGATRAEIGTGEGDRNRSALTAGGAPDLAAVAKSVASADSAAPRRLGDGGLRLQSVVVLPSHLGGACFVLDVSTGSDTLGIPAIPRAMRIRFADFPTVDDAGLRMRTAESANLQGLASGAVGGSVRAREGAPAVANSYARTPVTEPAEALSWTHFSADTVVVQWPTATDIVVFRLGVVGDVVGGTAAGQRSVSPPARVTGRKVACGG